MDCIYMVMPSILKEIRSLLAEELAEELLPVELSSIEELVELSSAAARVMVTV